MNENDGLTMERRNGRSRRGLPLLLVLGIGMWIVPLGAVGAAEAASTHPGLELLLTEPLSFSPLSRAELEELWTVWPEPERKRAESATAEERRRLTFARYGLVERGEQLGGEAADIPLGYTSDAQGRLYPNCFSCHGGSVAGRTVPGLANNRQDLTALVGDLAALRAQRRGGDPELARQGATLGFPLNFSRGTSNATMYSILLGSLRDENLDVRLPPKLSQEFVHNSVDAPPWWHFKRKSRIYWDGMAPKSVRTLMQFTMAPGLSGESIRGWEDEFEVIKSYIESIAPPAFPFEIDAELALRGKVSFERTCARCHGTYGDEPVYPERVVPLAEIGTDPVRLKAITAESKAEYNRSWFSNYGEHPVRLETEGYVAPPLDGIWASAPYFHNGSVPTLHHVLHPEERPVVWRRVAPAVADAASASDYDERRVGVAVEELAAVPEGLFGLEAREYYDTGLPSQSNRGHLFPQQLTAAERLAVLEYLKTL